MKIANVDNHESSRWHEIAVQAGGQIETRLFIDGEYVDALEGGRFDTVNPANGEVLAEMAAGSAADIDRAVASAQRAFRSGIWSRMAPRNRADVLRRFADLIDANAEKLAVLETLDMGKPISDVIEDDLPAVSETIRFMAEGIDKIEGSVTNTEDDVMHFILREPLGVVGAISPWNYPLLMATWKIAPALAAGNTVVLKPAEQSPTSCLRLAELFVEAGMVSVNSYDEGDMTQPFGGYKQSGQAKDNCMESLRSYTQSKSAWIRLTPKSEVRAT